MNKHYNYVDETGHEYDDFKVLNDTGLRTKSNGCIIWNCVCKKCGSHVLYPGYVLRSNRHTRHCPFCGRRR